MNHIIYRLTSLTISWGFVGLIYEGSPFLQGTPTVLHPCFIDEFICFSPHAIWFYLSFFIIIPISFLYAPLYRVRWMSLSFIITGLIAGCIYLIFPTTMIPPIDHGLSMSSWLLRHLVSIDTPNNCSPSLHVSLTMIVVWGYINKKYRFISTLFIFWGMMICFSVLQLGRHLFIDFISGATLSIIVGCLVHIFLASRQDKER